MNNLLSTGLELMLVGMGVVFAFLVLLVLTIKLVAKLLDKFAPEQVTLTPVDKQPVTTSNASEITAAISVAVHKYRNNHSTNQH
ncbi:MAG TPA: sodium pump decarboxylase subunit gamma [Crenotrichaceae bacterium]|nr:sodium pump decarboxylase subunit gamma [Crenotrichaceae bacterium]